MKAIKIREGKEELTNVGRLIDSPTLVDITDTVLDPKIEKEGGWIDFPQTLRDIYMENRNRIYYPAFQQDKIGRFIILNDIAVCANRLIRVIEEFREEKCEESTLKLAFSTYQLSIVNALTGKTGVISSSIISSRTAKSARAVLLINGDRHPEFVGLPDTVLARLQIKEHDPVIVGRDPSIWHGSIEVLRAARSNNDCIELHPLIFSQLAADCDGDQVYVYKIPETPECFLEGLDQILLFTKKHAKWPGWLSKEWKQGEDVNWEKVSEETSERSRVIGFSISPRDILDKHPKVGNLCTAINKSGAEEECFKIANGIAIEEVKQYLLDQNATQLNMKVWLGPIGAASNRLKVLAGDEPELLESAMYVSERLQQMLLSSKHVVGNDKKEAYSVQDALTLLNRKGKYTNLDLGSVLREVGKMGLDEERAAPIIKYLWVGYPVLRTATAYLKASKEFNGSSTRKNALARHVMGICLGPIKEIKERVESILSIMETCRVRATFNDFKADFAKNTAGLADFCTADFPVFDLCAGARREDIKKQLVQRVLLNHEKDPSGLTRVTIEIAEDLIKKQTDGRIHV